MNEEIYLESDLKDIWTSLVPNKSSIIQCEIWLKTSKALYCEGKLAIPNQCLKSCLSECHKASNHTGAERTLLFFLSHFYSLVSKKELLEICKAICLTCEVCVLSKQNRPMDRGRLATLPLPSVANEVLCLDFVQMDPYNGYDYVLTLVDHLSHFVQFIPTQKSITGEGVLRLILDRWISIYGKPAVIRSDNDVRFRQNTGFYQAAFRALDVKLSFSLPRLPRSNGFVENVNKQFLQNLRALSLTTKNNNWPQLFPYCTFLMNAQISPETQMSPHEMFLGRPAWRFDLPNEPITNPETHSWIMEQLELQEVASRRLKVLRNSIFEQQNKRRVDANILADDFVLVSNKRWPNKNFPKLSPQWQGPFRVLKVRFNSVKVAASPSLGGIIEVSLQLCKKWTVEDEDLPEEIDDPILEDQVQGDQPMASMETPKESGRGVPMTDEEQAQIGFYNVFEILKHENQGGRYKFLVWWENFPASSSTWEPVKSFVHPEGKVNEIFPQVFFGPRFTHGPETGSENFFFRRKRMSHKVE